MITSVAGIALLDTEKAPGRSHGVSGVALGSRLIGLYVLTSLWCALWGLLIFNVFHPLISTESIDDEAMPAPSISLGCSAAAGGGWVVEASGWSGLAAREPPQLLCNASATATAATFIVNGTGAAGTGGSLAKARTFTGTALALLEGLFPDNYLAAFTTDNLLGVITASVVLGSAAVTVGLRRKREEAATAAAAGSGGGRHGGSAHSRASSGDSSPSVSVSAVAAAAAADLAAAGATDGSPSSSGRQRQSFAARIAGASASSYTAVERQQRAENRDASSATLGERTGSLLVKFAEEVQALVVVVVDVAILAAPIAVASLLGATFAAVSNPGKVFAEAGLLVGMHALAVAAHAVLFLPLMHGLVLVPCGGFCCCCCGSCAEPDDTGSSSRPGGKTKRSAPISTRKLGGLWGVYRFMWQYCTDSYLTAFATSSSAATLPVTIKNLVSGGVRADLARFSASLGATLNLDGTSCGYPIVALWMAATSGIPFGATEQAVVTVMAVLASIGAAPIPQAGTVLLISIWAGAFPDNPLPAAFAVFLSVDALMDRVETTANVVGDSLAGRTAAVWAGFEEELVSIGRVTGQADDESDEQVASSSASAQTTTTASHSVVSPLARVSGSQLGKSPSGAAEQWSEPTLTGDDE